MKILLQVPADRSDPVATFSLYSPMASGNEAAALKDKSLMDMSNVGQLQITKEQIKCAKMIYAGFLVPEPKRLHMLVTVEYVVAWVR